MLKTAAHSVSTKILLSCDISTDAHLTV